MLFTFYCRMISSKSASSSVLVRKSQSVRRGLVEIIPIIIKFGNMFLSRLVLGVLRIVQVEGVNLAYQEGFDTGLVALPGDGVGFFGDSQLLRLVIKMFHQQENILIEVYLFLANL